MNDFSRVIWLYLMKNRSEVHSFFETIYNKIKNQFGMFVHTLQTCNAKEFNSSSFIHFIFYTGISRQTSYPYTPQ